MALGVGLRAAAGFVTRPWAAAASPLRALGLSGAPCAAPFGPRCAGPGSSRRAGLGRRCRPCSPPPRPACVRFRKTKPIAPQGIPGLGPYDIPTRKEAEMDREQSKMRLFQAGIEAMSADERAALKAAMEQAREDGDWEMLELIVGIASALGRSLARQDSDKRTDAKRRVLVGAHVPRGLAERVKAAAAAKGVSQYRFLVDGIERMCDDEKAGVGREGGA